MDIVTRKIHFYTCSKCGKARRSTLNEEKAKEGMCRKCKALQPPKGQTSIFDQEGTHAESN